MSEIAPSRSPGFHARPDARPRAAPAGRGGRVRPPAHPAGPGARAGRGRRDPVRRPRRAHGRGVRERRRRPAADRGPVRSRGAGHHRPVLPAQRHGRSGRERAPGRRPARPRRRPPAGPGHLRAGPPASRPATSSAPTPSPGPEPSAQRPLRAVLDGLGRYEALAGEAMYLDGQGSGRAGPAAGRRAAALPAGHRPAPGRHPARRAPAHPGQLAAALDRAYQVRRSAALAGTLWIALGRRRPAGRPGRPAGLPGGPVPAAGQPGAGRGRSWPPWCWRPAAPAGCWPRPGTCGWPRSTPSTRSSPCPRPAPSVTTPTPTRAATWSTPAGPSSTSRRSRASPSSWPG